MACARCGSEEAGPPTLNMYLDYEYCQECNEIFEEAQKNGVSVRSRHTNRAFDHLPYEVSVNVEGVSSPHTANSANRPLNQTEALAMGKWVMEKHGLPGVFIYQKTGSVWLIDEYLDTHPGIAQDVRREQRSLFTRLYELFF